MHKTTNFLKRKSFLEEFLTRSDLVWHDEYMPSKNSVKFYMEDAYYHVYNRGVEGRDIFIDDNDYKVFLSFIKRYLVESTQNEVRPRWEQEIHKQVELKCYCLMPNHFHFLIKQNSKDGITKFMRALMNCYVKFFNKKYKRVGGLFQGKFKAVRIEKDLYLLHLTRYIHLNPLQSGITYEDLENYYCSYGEYIGKRSTKWIRQEEILNNFGSKFFGKDKFTSYKDFVEKYTEDPRNILGELLLE